MCGSSLRRGFEIVAQGKGKLSEGEKACLKEKNGVKRKMEREKWKSVAGCEHMFSQMCVVVV